MVFCILQAAFGLYMVLILPVISILNSPVSSDGNLIKVVLAIALVNCILGFVSVIIYNLSPKFREYKNSLPIVFAFFLIAVLIVQLIPVIFNIPLTSL